MEDTKINLCDTCIFEIPTCAARPQNVEYGDGVGNDNIIECTEFEDRENFR